MFGRKLALTTMPAKTKTADVDATPETTPMDFEKLAELTRDTIVTTAVALGIVAVSVKVIMTVCNVAEDAAKKHL